MTKHFTFDRDEQDLIDKTRRKVMADIEDVIKQHKNTERIPDNPTEEQKLDFLH